MVKEIERKFLLWENGIDYSDPYFLNLYQEGHYHSPVDFKEIVLEIGEKIKQGYLELELGKTLANKWGISFSFEPIEARLRQEGSKHFFTIKGNGTLTRDEENKQIGEGLFNQYWQSTVGKRVEKIRLKKPYCGQTLELDVYTDRDLIIAEVEFPDEISAMAFQIIGKEITKDDKYKNRNLAK